MPDLLVYRKACRRCICPHHKGAIGEFTQWFHEKMELEYMGYDCSQIVGTNPAKKVQYCPGIIASTYEKCMEILENRGFL